MNLKNNWNQINFNKIKFIRQKNKIMRIILKKSQFKNKTN